MRSRTVVANIVLMWMGFLSSSADAQDQKLSDQTFVGNWFVFFNPTQGSGTQQLTVDVDESGSYIATDMQGEVPPVSAKLEAKDGKFTLRDKNNVIIDQGTYERLGPQIQLAGTAGKGFWTKVSGESKQRGLKDVGDLKAANFATIAAAALKTARGKWQKDAILVEATVIPNEDGSIDLTVSGGNGYLKFLSPSTSNGCIGIVGSFGEVNLYPEDRAVSAFRWSIPTNIIDLPSAMSTAKKEAKGAIKQVALYGCGDDADLRQFCWVLTTQDSVVAVDALLSDTTDYREFMDGRERARKVPFMPNRGIVTFGYSFDGNGPPEMMWFAKHPVYLDGMEEAIIVQVPWRIIPVEEMMRQATRTAGGIEYRGESSLYPRGEHTPLAGEVLKQFMTDKDSIRLACAPFAVRSVKPLANYPAGTKERIAKQLEAYWHANGRK